MASRNLADLYTLGKEVKINDDGGGEPVVVWMSKLRTFQAEKALKKANAARAIRFSITKDKESDDYLSIVSLSHDIDREQMVKDVAGKDLVAKYQALEAQLGAEDEWAKDDYLQGLKDAWTGREGPNLSFRWAEDEDDPEAKRVHDELEKFANELQKRYDSDEKIILDSYDSIPEDKLREQWVADRIEWDANDAWFREFKLQELFYSIRDPQDHKKYYFGSRDEIDELAQEVLLVLISEYNALAVDVQEGKDSPSIQSSSPL